MDKDKALKLALDFVESINLGSRSASVEQQREVIAICKEALAHPPQRPWVGLEGEEIRYLWEEATKPDRSTMTMVTSFAKDIEAKLKEKNNG